MEQKWAISVHDRSGNKRKVESEKWNKSEKWKAKKNETKEELYGLQRYAYRYKTALGF